MTAPLEEAVAERLASLRRRVAAAGRDPGQVRIVGVTKGFGPEAARAALAAGLSDLGENYAAELIEKAAALSAGGPGSPPPAAGIAWHFLGAVQRNKVARLAPLVACWHGVDRLEEGLAIARHAPAAQLLVEVDCTGIGGRNGVPAEDVEPLVSRLRDAGVEVAGLMTVAPPGGGAPAGRIFARVAALAGELGLAEVSMGMSDDLDEALAAGATMLRIGRGLFGARPARPAPAGER